MKKLKLLLIAILTTLCLSFGVVAHAEESHLDGEINASSEEITSVEDFTESEITSEITSEETTEGVNEESSYTFTEEELKNFIDSVLDENQKSLISKISDFIGGKFGFNAEKIYIIIALGCALVLIFAVLFGKLISKNKKFNATNEQLKAVSAMLEEANIDKSKYKQLAQALTSENLEQVIKTNNEELLANITSLLKVDSNTVSELLTAKTLERAEHERFRKALVLVLEKSGFITAANELATSPTIEEMKNKELENIKLRTALGEETVKKVLSE